MEAENKLFKTESIDALISLYAHFLENQGYKVSVETEPGVMKGGENSFELVVLRAIFMAVCFYLAITYSGESGKNVDETLKKAATNPEEVVKDMIENHPEDLAKAQQRIEDFQFSDVYAIQDGSIENTLMPVLKNVKTQKEIINAVAGVAAAASKKLDEVDFSFRDVYDSSDDVSGEMTVKPEKKLGKHLEIYLKNYTDAVKATNRGSPKTNPLALSNTQTATEEEPAVMASDEDLVGMATEEDDEDLVGIPSDAISENDLNIKPPEPPMPPAPPAPPTKKISPFRQNYLDALAASKNRGGSKTKRQNKKRGQSKRKRDQSKRKRGGSNKQKKRTNKRR